MSKLTVILAFLLVLSQVVFSQNNPKELFNEVHKAIEENNIENLSKYITKEKSASPESINALAELIIFSQSSAYKSFGEKNKEKIKGIKNPDLIKYLQDMLFLEFIPNIEETASSGVYDDTTKEFKIPEAPSYLLRYLLTQENEKWTFSIADTKSYDQFIYLNNFLKDFTQILESTPSPSDEIEKRIAQLIQKYPK